MAKTVISKTVVALKRTGLVDQWALDYFLLLQSKLAELPAVMPWKRKGQGGLLAFVGFMLSPLSWWNDAFVNVPIAIGFGWIVARCYKPAFEPAVVVGYWLTNVLGFVLMHKGAQRIVSETQLGYTRRDFARDVAVSLAYTLLIIALLRWRILQPFENYFPEK